MKSEKIKIAIAHRHELFRKSLSALLQTKSEMEVLSDYANGKLLLHAFKKEMVDILLLDSCIALPGSTLILQQVKERFPGTRVIVLSDEKNTTLPSDFIQLGAHGFLGANGSIATLFHAIHEVSKGAYYLDDAASLLLLDSILKNRNKNLPVLKIELSERETSILEQLCDGNTNKAIALNLHLSVSAIDFYRTRLYQKTNCNNAVGLLKYALKHGLVALG